MRRKRNITTENNEPGQDSFLDIVSNMVGILIILVVVAGLRVKQMPLYFFGNSEETATVAGQFEEKQAVLAQTQHDALRVSQQLETMQQQSSIREVEHDELLRFSASLEAQIHQYNESKDAVTQKSFQLQRELYDLDAKLNQIVLGADWLQKNRSPAITLENHPTPKTRTVEENEKEVHFRLMKGKIVHVPVPQLIERLKLEVIKRQSELLTSRARLSGVIGPIDDFRLKYTVVRRDLPPQVAYATGQSSIIELQKCEFLPVLDEIGEDLQSAFQKGSHFMQRISVTRQSECTMTLWVYPDSFSMYQQVKDFLFRQGYQTAARPLDFGVPIAASPEGTRTARQ